ncbi:phosphatidylglycerophosphatase A family protein [Rhodohalobacter mucosus]|uniref:Phosphatidylglycerophosphatase A n=1 Tax=Rhodohalobacter mucosus TaxID=2079485 RepID=A0A316TL30_9BACT|nr:phosphatidylglycerophosphatase A [Rhodohalobacter mucosus]PWN05273.1 phosphatidylglycerophosphatase A [Rhodohalobacter mucosus]
MLSSPKILTGTLLGIGFLPKAPGTWASAATLPLLYFSWLLSPMWGIPAFAFIAIILSLWAADHNIHEFGDDPPEFVMDECAGQALVFVPVALLHSSFPDLFHLFTGFFFFRVFDILKPFGVDRLQKLPGKFGILGDDLLAGLYATICTELILTLKATLF